MRKILILLFLAFVLSGCATYRFKKPASSASQGYLVTYDGDPVLEYTVGKDKTLPDLALAKERFKRRRVKVEYYYKKMGLLESRLREVFWDPPAMFMDFLSGILRWPFIAIADYRYHHNPKYKEKMDRLDEEQEAMEKARVNSLKEKLASYIVEDLAKEPPVLPAAQEAAPEVETPVAGEITPEAAAVAPVSAVPVKPMPAAAPVVVAPPVETKSPIIEAPVIKKVLEPPVAVIIAKPLKGYSPLKVSFSGQKSYSKNGKIVSYLWDFGDGDRSTKNNPENTYWSTTYGSRNFTVTLTVKDAAGAASSTTSSIEVSTP